METKAIVTMPPYAPFITEVLKHPIVSGIRLNTVMPVKGLEETLAKLKEHAEKEKKDLWIDLKCRQLRVKTYGVPPFTEVELSHNIEVYTPVKAFFGDKKTSATVLKVDKNRLIMQEGPRRVVGPGESVTIMHPTLKIEGYFTDSDLRYIEAGKKLGINNYMLSFVEGDEDIKQFRKLISNADIIAKIESQKGLDNLEKIVGAKAKLMAARGDLYMELYWPHSILEAVENIYKIDSNAVAASRILGSLADSPEPSSEDLGDVDNLMRIGYRTLMLGDEVCLRRESVISALNVLTYIAKRYERG